MILLLQTILAIFAIVMLAEFLWRSKILGSEYSRKLIHIFVGTFAAFWGFYLTDNQIILLSSAMLAVVFLSRFLGLFASIHSVNRKTWGELFFPLGIAVSAVLTDSPWIFLAAVLHVSLADGLAAIVGRMYVKKHGYKVLGQQKTTVGTFTFILASIFIILAVMLLATDIPVSMALILLVPLVASLVENIGMYGSDDLLVPIVVSVLLSNF